jgi:putative hydrolase of the HAD superfamily
MTFNVLFFDLDDTLYAKGNGLWEAIRARMGEYLHERLGFSTESIPELRRNYFEKYGTTLRGLQINHQVDADDYLAYVHNLPLENFLQPDPALRNLITSIPQPKWIFTNADDQHAHRVLTYLGIEDCFHGIIDVRAMKFHCKPEVKSYELAMEIAGESNPARCVYLDDSLRNLAPARELGFFTIWVGSSDPHPAANYSITNLSELPAVLPELWPNGRQPIKMEPDHGCQ